ncbi:6-phosphogluconate dehydrogenase C-terminal domain-like protein [Xylariaceae sp. FL1651]|nr:6-phosphogluconate dehydrogenase C-terminal domain-like protein [Xylariaceae sp. FL1651]
MRIIMLSTIGARASWCHLKSSSNTCRRLLYSSAKMQRESASQIPAEWLRRVVEDGAKPPKLYAWTPENLPANGCRPGSSYNRKEAGISKDGHRRIYILGIGNIGRLYAMCFSKLTDPPPITLVVHREELLEHWAAEPGIELTRHGQVHKSADFDIEWWTDVKPTRGPVVEPGAGSGISNLIVATKASDAMPQVDRLRGYLGSESTVAFAQNGMCKLWPPLGDVYVRARFAGGRSPNWVACVTTHGVTSQGPFKSIHAAPANALVGLVMPGSAGKKHFAYLMEQIANAPDLDARRVSRKELWIAQLEKLVVNATINPLTAVLRCKNGEIFANRGDNLPGAIDKLLSEASKTLRALVLDKNSDDILLSESTCQAGSSARDFLQASHEQLSERFAFSRLRNMVLDVGVKVAPNTSSMLQDVRAGKQTEINDFNGWLVDTAKLLDRGLQLPTHEKLIALVKSQAELTRAELCAQLLGDGEQATQKAPLVSA